MYLSLAKFLKGATFFSFFSQKKKNLSPVYKLQQILFERACNIVLNVPIKSGAHRVRTLIITIVVSSYSYYL